MNDIQNNSNKFLIKTIEVNNARLLLDKVPNIIILEINEDSLIVSSKDNLNFNTLVQLLNDKISIQSIKKESGLIDFFYD
jgi:hypothetical protein